VSLKLSNPAGSNTLGSPAETTLTIRDRSAASVDHSAPTVAVAGLTSPIKSSALRHGLSLQVTPSEPSALQVDLLGTVRSARLRAAGDVILASSSLPLAGGTRTVTLKPNPKLIPRRSFRARVLVSATDASGNSSQTVEELKVKR